MDPTGPETTPLLSTLLQLPSTVSQLIVSYAHEPAETVGEDVGTAVGLEVGAAVGEEVGAAVGDKQRPQLAIQFSAASGYSLHFQGYSWFPGLRFTQSQERIPFPAVPST